MVKLKTADLAYLLSTFELPRDVRNELEQALQKHEGISDDAADELLEMCSDRLMMVGFDKDYNPTKEGEYLESMIDKLNVEL